MHAPIYHFLDERATKCKIVKQKAQLF